MVNGRDAADCWMALGTDVNSAVANVTIGCREEWFSAIVLIGLQGVTKVVCGGKKTLHTILLNVTTEGYGNMFIVMGYVPDNTDCCSFMGLQGVVLFYTT